MEKLISVVVPVYNEAGNVRAVALAVSRALAGERYELVFVDDGSTDASSVELASLAAEDERVRLVALTRNFGKEAALSAGIAASKGDAVALMDADLQHPPELLPKLLAEWEAGADVVVGVRQRNPDEGIVRRFASRAFSIVMRNISDVPSISGATDFRVIDRVVADEFNRFTERGRITRGLIDWLGYRRAYVPFDAGKRHSGTAQYGFRKLVALGISAFLSHSLLPLRVAGYLGIPITLFSGGLGLFIIIEQFMLGDPLGMDISPIGMSAVMILFLNGIVLICLGLVSLYVARIHAETVNRPLYVVRKDRAR